MFGFLSSLSNKFKFEYELLIFFHNNGVIHLLNLLLLIIRYTSIDGKMHLQKHPFLVVIWILELLTLAYMTNSFYLIFELAKIKFKIY